MTDETQEEISDVEYGEYESDEYEYEPEKKRHYPAFLSPVFDRALSYRRFERMIFESDRVKKICMAVTILVFVAIIIASCLIMKYK